METKESIEKILLVFGQNIRNEREKQNLDINELATRVQYDRICLSRLEYGEQNITYKTAIKLAKELNVSFPALFSRNYSIGEADSFYPDDFLMIFCENIHRELMVKGKAQIHIYIECGVHESVVSRILSGKTINPTLNTLHRIAAGVTSKDMTRLFSRNEL